MAGLYANYLTTDEKASLQAVVDYLTGNYEKPLDDVSANTISKLHVKFGYSSQIAYLEALRDAPYSTLLNSLLAVAGTPIQL